MSNKIKILYIAKINFDTASHRSTAINWVKGFQKKGYQIDLVTTYDKETPDFGLGESIHFIAIPKTPIIRTLVFFWKTWWMLLPILWGQKVDLVILDKNTFFLAFPFDLLGKLGLRKKLRVVVDFRDDVAHKTSSKAKNVLAKIMNFIGPSYAALMTSGVSATTRVGIKRGLFRPKYSCPIPSGFDSSIFNAEQSKSDFIPKHKEGTLTLIYAGFLGLNRGLVELVEAFQYLRNKDKVYLYFVGSGIIEEQIKEKIEQLKLEDQIKMLGFVPQQELPGYILSCDFGILPYPNYSMWEMSSPLKLSEFLALGKPVIMRRLAGVGEYVGDLPYIFFLDDNHPKVIAEKLDEIIEMDREIPAFVPEHHERAMALFSWEGILSNFDDYIHLVLER